MRKKDNQTSGAVKVQVFELTMDNPENQDELNRRLHKRNEPDKVPPREERAQSAHAESTTASARKQKRES